MPGNGEALDGDVVPFLIGKTVEGWLVWWVGDPFCPHFLDDF
jgi:hypothetical protein